MNAVTRNLKNLGGVISKNSPLLLTGCGCAGVFATAVLTGRATLQASKLVEDGQWRKGENFTATELIRETWKVFVPPIIVGGLSIACIVGANGINTKRNAALAALYSLSETAFREYKDKVVERIGESKELRLRDEIAKDRILAHPSTDRTIFVTGNGDVLCYDVLGDRYFTSSAEKIKQQVVELNYRLMTDVELSLNDLYESIGLKPTKLGEQVGFNIDKGLIDISFSSCLNEHDQPCLSIDTSVYPRGRW